MKDEITLLLRRITDILLMKNPIGTTMGILVGIIAYEITQKYFNSYSFSVFFYISIGVIIFNLKTYFSGQTELDDDVEKTFRVIRESVKSGNLSKAQEKMMYKSVAEKYIEKKFPEKNREYS